MFFHDWDWNHWNDWATRTEINAICGGISWFFYTLKVLIRLLNKLYRGTTNFHGSVQKMETFMFWPSSKTHVSFRFFSHFKTVPGWFQISSIYFIFTGNAQETSGSDWIYVAGLPGEWRCVACVPDRLNRRWNLSVWDDWVCFSGSSSEVLTVPQTNSTYKSCSSPRVSFPISSGGGLLNMPGGSTAPPRGHWAGPALWTTVSPELASVLEKSSVTRMPSL